jgi:TrmH family RNA methyltransferase
MEHGMLITSLQNERIKRMVALGQKSSLRRSEGVIVVEGRRELEHCLQCGHEVVAVYHCPALLDSTPACACPHYEVTREVYEKIAYRGSTEGVIAEVRPRQLTLDDLRLGEQPLMIVLEAVEKPGNLGAVLRSADAAHADAVVVCDPLTDLYNPNIIRSSIGAIFTVPCVACTSEECISYLKTNNIQILTAQLQDSLPYYDTDMRCGTAIVMGTESTGLTNQWRAAADRHIRIPMKGQLDSLNVSVSAAILLFEAVRQREKR